MPRRLKIPGLHERAGKSPIYAMMRSMSDTIALLSQSLADDFHVLPLQMPDAAIFMAVAVPLWEGVTGLKPRLPAGRGMSLQHSVLTAAAEALELRASLAQNHPDAGASGAKTDGFAQIPAVDLVRGDTVHVPAQAVYLDFANHAQEPLVTDADSTGCATGPSREAALLHGVLECIERDAVALWWYGGLQRPAVPLDAIDALQPRLFWWLQERLRETTLLDLQTDNGVPVIVALSCLPDGSEIALGSAAGATQADAALAAITEMIQTETAINQARVANDPAVLDWIARGSMRSMIQFKALPAGTPPPKPDNSLGAILHRLANAGHRALAVDLTLPNDPMPTVRVMVPGFCAMGGRIDALRYERLIRKPFANLRLEPTEILEPF